MERPKSPPGTSWRSRENASASRPSMFRSPGGKSRWSTGRHAIRDVHADAPDGVDQFPEPREPRQDVAVDRDAGQLFDGPHHQVRASEECLVDLPGADAGDGHERIPRDPQDGHRPLRGVHADDVERIAARAFGGFAGSRVAPDHQDEDVPVEASPGEPAALRTFALRSWIDGTRLRTSYDAICHRSPSDAACMSPSARSGSSPRRRRSRSLGTGRTRPRRADGCPPGTARRSSTLPADLVDPYGRSASDRQLAEVPADPRPGPNREEGPQASGSGRRATRRDRRIRSSTSASSPCGRLGRREEPGFGARGSRRRVSPRRAGDRG